MYKIYKKSLLLVLRIESVAQNKAFLFISLFPFVYTNLIELNS